MPTDAKAATSPAKPDAITESSTDFSVPTDPEAYARWRMEGKVPEVKPGSAAPKKPPTKPAAAATAETSDDASDSGESGVASEAANDKQGEQATRRSADKRLNEILKDLQRAGLSPAELKSFKREQTQAVKPPEVKKPEALKRPQIEDFATTELYEAALDAYTDKRADERAEIKFQQKERERIEREQAVKNAERLEAAEKRYGAEAKTVIESTAATVWNDKAIPEVFRQVIDDSPVVADLLYTLGSDPDELDKFIALAKKTPGVALRKLVLMEELVNQELGKTGKKPAKAAAAEDAAADDADDAGDDDEQVDNDQVDEQAQRDATTGKFVAAKPPAKKITSAPPPPHESSGQSGSPGDPVAKAVSTNDFRTFREERNRKDLARAKG